MKLLQLIQQFWEAIFNKNDNIAYWLTILTVFLIPIYALGVLKYFDALLYRVSQLIIRPFNVLIYFLDKASSSVEDLKFKYHVANFIFVLCAVAMLVTEYTLIQDFLESKLNPMGTSGEVPAEIAELFGKAADTNSTKQRIFFLGIEISVSNVLTISYLSIVTLLGYFVFELSTSFKKIYKKVLDPNIEEGENQKQDIIYIGFFLLLLVILAGIQGWLGLSREEQVGAGLNTKVLLVSSGFLTPIIAGVGLMSFHIFFAQIAMLLKLTLQILKDFVIAICLQIIALVDFVSALITKSIILFLGVEGDLKDALENERDKLKNHSDNWHKYWTKAKISLLKRLAPVETDDDNYSIYILDKLDITSEYANAFWKKRTLNSKLVFICEHPKFELEKNLSEVYFRKNNFDDIAQEVVDYCKKNFQGSYDDLEKSKVTFWVVIIKDMNLEEKNVLDIASESGYEKIPLKKLFSYDRFLIKIENNR